MFQALCEASHQGPRFGKPLSQCDIYGSIEAGNRLRYVFGKVRYAKLFVASETSIFNFKSPMYVRAMMSLGASEPWDVALKIVSRDEKAKLDARPLMEYFRPLHEWLLVENRRSNYTIGFR